MHRYTAVEPILFRAVCQAIAKYAFVTSDLPVIISLEVHCHLDQQKKMVQVRLLPWSSANPKILREEFGDMLLKDRLDGVDLDILPSPLLLKRKILLKVPRPGIQILHLE
jgi:phosphatidylinositol phospholipase C, delta